MPAATATATAATAAAPTPSPARPGPGWLRWLPTALALAVAAGALLERADRTPALRIAILGAAAFLLGWQALVLLRARGVPLAVEVAAPIKQHYIQACVQTSLYVYWGWWWVQDGVRPIYQQAPLILLQFAFLYAFDALLQWSRGRPWRLSSGPTPIVLSTNLFIWFRDDAFGWQFAVVALGLLGKEFVKWTKDGRRTHVFNPSGFALACAATALVATNQTDLTWAKSLATTIEAPGIYLYLFSLGLVVQNFFQVTLMTFAAAVAMVVANLAYTQWTGVYLFGSSNLPAAAFLGLHLLMTDPSTSPRSNVGRTLFGLGYGFGYIVAFELLGRLGAPELYAKLYPVPVLNCCVQWLDGLARRGVGGRLEARWQTARPARSQNRVHMALWAATFAVLFGTGYLGGAHPGDSIPFWKQAVADGKPDAQRKLALVAGSQAIARQSGEAFNELGILALTGDVDPASERTRFNSAADWFAQAALRRSDAAVHNLVAHFLYHGARRDDRELDAAFQRLSALAARPDGGRARQLLGLAYETGGGRPLDLKLALDRYRGCPDDVFAQRGIVRIALQPGSLVDLPEAARARLVADAASGDGEALYSLTYLRARNRAGADVAASAAELLARAKAAGFPPAVAAPTPTADGALPPYVAPRRRDLAAPPWASSYAAAVVAAR
jgi:hypothetical protein